MKRPMHAFLNNMILLLVVLLANSITYTGLSAQVNNYFIENKGQWPKNVLFLTKSNGVNTWITKEGVIYDYHKRDIVRYKTDEEISASPKGRDYELGPEYGHVIAFRHMGTIIDHVQLSNNKMQKNVTRYNYFYGSDSQKWVTDVETYKEITIVNAFEGIDMRYYFDKGRLRYDYIVKPGFSVSNIKFEIEGSPDVRINNSDEIVVVTRFGEVKHCGLTTYQEVNGKKQIIKSSFIQNKNGKMGFAVGKYDKTKNLIIDPVTVEWATYIGGSDEDWGYGSTVTSNNDVIIGGTSYGTSFPTSTGSYDQSFNGIQDATISKLSADGSALLWSTYIGSPGDDQIYGVAVDASDNVYVTGNCIDGFPVTAGVVQSTFSGFSDCFVSKFNTSGNTLIFSTYVGGSNQDRGQQIAVTPTGEAVITGFTESTNFPTNNAYQGTYGGGNGSGRGGDIIVTKLNSTATAYVFSTYLGGVKDDMGYGIAISGTGNIYLSGTSIGSLTPTPAYPTTPSAYKTTQLGNNDVVVSCLSSTGTLLYSTYFGGTLNEESYGIGLNIAGEVIISGFTASKPLNGFPVTAGCFQNTHKGGTNDIFVAKFDATLSTLLKCTYIGGTGQDIHTGQSIHPHGYIFVGGRTASTNYPIKNAYQGSSGGNYDACVTILSPNFDTLAFSSYIGGSGYDYTYGFYTGQDGKVIATGRYSSNGFATTPGAYQLAYGGGNSDIFALKINVREITLPVDLLFFKANCQNSLTTLYWATANETNNDYFTLERSTDLSVWEAVAKIPGAVNSNTHTAYSYSDPEFYRRALYYRLTQTDLNGQSKTFTPVIVRCDESKVDVECYPNPFDDQLVVTLQNIDAEHGCFILRDVTSRVVMYQELNADDLGQQSIAFTMSGLATGVYSLEFHAGSYEKTMRIVKNK